MKKTRILHISTAHPAQDPRIAQKVIPSLSFQYELLAALPHVPTGKQNNVQYLWLPKFKKLLLRILFCQPLVLWYALRYQPRLLHLYNPELLPLARLIQLLLDIPVIYEVHENFHKKIAGKAANQGAWAIKPFQWADKMARRRFYLIFTEHGYLDTYTGLAKPYAVIYNFPVLSFLNPFRRAYAPNQIEPEFFYIGLISFERAFDTLVSALALLKNRYPNFTVHLFGDCRISKTELNALPGYSSIEKNLRFYGYTDQQLALPYITNATVGLALLKPVGDYMDSYTTKMFEYMALGIPVLTSDFPLYREVVERHRCGLCVSPLNPIQVANALVYLVEHPEQAKVMGERGYQAVQTDYCWQSESEKLLNFYTCVLGKEIE
ncbi:glycosyltransferase [Spirosoma sp. SC4-14]|uniref:glycosyltransferase n=1 Tax=Spirosoma sp. SC4-14 TaxID=3128900 RepID=UPI0030CE06A5